MIDYLVANLKVVVPSTAALVAGVILINSGLDKDARQHQALLDRIENNKVAVYLDGQLITTTVDKANLRYQSCYLSQEQLFEGKHFPLNGDKATLSYSWHGSGRMEEQKNRGRFMTPNHHNAACILPNHPTCSSQ